MGRRGWWPWFLLGVALVGWVGGALAEVGEEGSPRGKYFEPKPLALTSGRQVWAIMQDPRGLLYFGTGQGVLEYDGIHWRAIPVANGTTARSLAVDANGRIWVGAQGDLGHLTRGATGAGDFVSLLDRVPEDARTFTDVWKTHTTSHGVYFQSFEHLLRWDGAEMHVFRPTASFHFSFLVDDELWIVERGRGLRRFVPGDSADGGRLEDVPGGEHFADERIYALLPYDGETLLAATRDSGFFLVRDGSVEPFATDLIPFVRESRIYHGVVLGDGTFALATLQGGVVIIDRRGRLRRVVDRSSGLANDGVKYLFNDAVGALWLGLDRGISRLDLVSRWSTYGETEGLEGTPLAIERHGGRLYVASSRGLFRLVNPSQTQRSAVERPRFEAVPGVRGQVFALWPTESGLVVAGVGGVFTVDAGLDTVDAGAAGVRPIAEYRASELHRSREDPNRMFVALFDGLASLRLDGGVWTDEGRWPRVDQDIRALAELGGALWLITKDRRLLRLRDSTDPDTELDPLDRAAGMPQSGVSWLVEGPTLDSDDARTLYLVGGERGRSLFRLDPQGEHLMRLPMDLGMDREATFRWIHVDAGDDFWLGGQRLSRIRWDDNGRQGVVEPAANGLGTLSVSTLERDDDGVLWLGLVDGLVRYDRGRPGVEVPRIQSLIRRVARLDDLDRTLDGPCAAADQELPFEARSLRFDFAAPALAGVDHVAFQSWLQGFEESWAPWRVEAHRDFTQLPPGDFRLLVRARDPAGTVGPPEVCRFTILAPWYRTTTFGVAGIFLVLGGLVVSVRELLRRARLRAHRQAEDDRRRQELESARRLQQRLLPVDTPDLPYLEIAAHQETATEVGGDYYDFFPRSDGSLLAAIGDATGHGLASGVLVTATKAILLSLREGPMDRAAETVNGVLARMDFERRMNMALAVIDLRPLTGRGVAMVLSGGGIAPIYVLRAAGGHEEILLGGLPLGAMASASFRQVDCRLHPGDMVVMMSDGLPEITDPKGEFLGYERLTEALVDLGIRYRAAGRMDTAGEMLRAILAVGDRWTDGRRELNDDLTLLVFKVLA